MARQTTWRDVPASLLEDIYNLSNRVHCPPTLAEMVRLVRRYGVRVEFVPAHESAGAFARTDPPGIIIPTRARDLMLLDLVHEVSELLLRLPVEAEFHYQDTGADEFHAVATLTADRLKQYIRENRDKLQEEEIAIEAELARLVDHRRQHGLAIAAYGQAIADGEDVRTLTRPSAKALRETVTAIEIATARLRFIRARLRG